MWFLSLGDELKEAAIDVLRKISFWVCAQIYPLIPKLYNIAETIGKHQYFKTEDITNISRNIYVLVCVIMLFSIGIRLISAIVNPDLLDEKKKGAKTVFLNSLAAVFLIILVPLGFEKAYQFQEYLIDEELVPRIILGADMTSADGTNIGGQILAGYTFSSFCTVSGNLVTSAAISSDGLDIYNKTVTEDINYVKDMVDEINGKNTDGSYTLEYNGLLAPLAGGFVVYELILLCMDLALRGLKLGLLQLIAPIVICGFIFKGSELLSKWFKEVFSTYILIFLKIAALVFMIYGLSLLNGFLDTPDFAASKGIISIFVIIGLFQIIKQIPTIINTIFGTNIQSRGGIRGRLGEMAAIGNMAQNAWDQVTKHPLQTARRAVSAPLSAVGGGLAHTVAAFRRGHEIANKIRNSEGNQRFKGARALAMGAGSALGGLLTSGGAALRAGRQGWKDGNLRGIGQAGQRYDDIHVPGSTLGGRIGNSFRNAMGISNSADEAINQWEKKNDDYVYVDPNTGEAIKFGSLEDVNRRKNSLTESMVENKEKNRLLDEKINHNQENVISQAKIIKDRADEKNMEATSTIKIGAHTVTTASGQSMSIAEGNLNSYQNLIDAYKKGAPDKADEKYMTVPAGVTVPDKNDSKYYTYSSGSLQPTFDQAAYDADMATYNSSRTFDQAAYDADLAAHTEMVSALEADFKTVKENEAREKYVAANSTGAAGEDSTIYNALNIMQESGNLESRDYYAVHDRDTKAKVENSNLSTEKSKNTEQNRNYEIEMQKIAQAEEAHKRAKEEFEASQAQITRTKNKESDNNRRGNGGSGGSSSKS